MLGTAGHVDHGKTALVKLLTGCDTDTLTEEKERGLTIDLGFAPCRLADQRIVGVVDVPGHVDFIRNMVAGAHGVDVVILVVAADDGIMPQTREHLQILTLMGLRHGLVALTKIDLVEPARRDEVAAELRQLLAGTFLREAPICPMSNLTGEGFEGFFDALNQVVNGCQERPVSGVFRLWVEDVFSLRGPGTILTGIPTGGIVRAGESLALLPGEVTGRVRRMQVYGEDAVEGRAGECVALNIPELDPRHVRRGMLLCPPETLSPVAMAEAELQLLPDLKTRVPDLVRIQLHVGTASVPAQVAMLETPTMSGGQRQMVQLRLAEPLPVIPGERFVARANLGQADHAGLVTIGGGRILGTTNVRLRRRRPWTLEALAARREALDCPAAWCELMLRESREPLSPRQLQQKCLLRQEELNALLNPLEAGGRVIRLPGGLWTHRQTVDQAAARLLGIVQSFHAANPQRAGLEAQELFARARANPVVGSLAVESLIQSGKLERSGTVLARKGWSARLTDRDAQLCEKLVDMMRQAKWSPPSPGELAVALKEPLERVGKMIRLLTDRGQLVQIERDLVLHPEALEAARQTALGLFAKKPVFSTMEFRDALGVSRKYAVPILDYFDRIRLTVRTGHDRTPGVEARKALQKPA